MKQFNPDSYQGMEVEKLLLLISQGNEKAFAALFESYRNRVFAVALRYLHSNEEAEEIVQDVFLQIWKSQADLKGVLNIEAFLYTISRNRIFNSLKQKARLSLKQEKMFESEKDRFDGIVIDNTLIDKQNSLSLKQAIERLPPQQKKIFKLSREEGLSYKKIGEVLNISPLTVKKHMAQALKTLRAELKEQLEVLSLIIPWFFL